MKIKLKDLREKGEALQKVLGTPLDVKLAYRIRKISGKIMNELTNVEKERIILIKKYGEKEEKTKSYVVSKDKTDAFASEFDKLLDVEVDIGGEKIPFECLEGIKLSGFEMAVLEDLIEEPKVDKPKIEK